MTKFTQEDDLIKPKHLTYLKRRAEFLLFLHQLKHDHKIDVSKGVRVTDTKFTAKSFKILFETLYDKLYSNYEVYESDDFKRRKHMLKLWSALNFIMQHEEFHTNNLNITYDRFYVKNIYVKYKNQLEYYTFDWDNYTVEFTAMKNG